MTETPSATRSLLGLPLPPPSLDGGGASEPLVIAEEEYARRAAREKEFVERVVRHSELLLAYARSRLRSEADAENAVQDVMHNAWNVDAVATCGGEDDRIQVYLLKAIRNRVANGFRERDRDRELKNKLTLFHRSRANDAVPPRQYAERREIAQAVDRALQELSWIHRESFRLVRWLGLKPQVAAQVLEMNVNTLRACVTETTRHLRKALASFREPNADGGRGKEETP